MNSFQEVLAAAKARAARERPAVAIAQAGDPDVMEALAAAEAEGLCRAIPVTAPGDDAAAARQAVELVRNGDAQYLMKGLLPTSTLLKAVLDEEAGLRTGRALSHAAVFEMPGREKLLFLTDAAMNTAPDLARKAEIIRNLTVLTGALGLQRPRIAALAAVETVSKAMPATLEAADLAGMARDGELGDVILEGPLSLDLAVSAESVKHKGMTGEVAGRADALLAPDIEAGNLLYKSLVYFGGGTPAGVVLGARAPILLVSRSDTPRSKLLSIAVANLISDHH